ncbi:MAG: hypothetical protein AABY53_08475 [Bdellovibrionota bacterium]
MNIKNLFSKIQFQELFLKVYLPSKSVEDQALLNLIAEKIKKFGLTPSKIDVFKTKRKIHGLCQIVLVGDIRAQQDVKIIISEDLIHNVFDLELEGQLAIAFALPPIFYARKYIYIHLVNAFLFISNFVILSCLLRSLPFEVRFLFLLFDIAINLMSFVAGIFIFHGFSHLGIYISAMRRFNMQPEARNFLKDNIIKKYAKFSIPLSILISLNFISPNQIRKFKEMLHDETEFDFLYMLNFFLKTPIILINVVTMLIAIVVSLCE